MTGSGTVTVSIGASNVTATGPVARISFRDADTCVSPFGTLDEMRKIAQTVHENSYYQRFNKQRVPRKMKT
jgi:hypothetical protein